MFHPSKFSRNGFWVCFQEPGVQSDHCQKWEDLSTEDGLLETKSKFTLETGLVGLVFKHEKQKQNLVLDLFENRITLSIQVLLWNWKSVQSRLWQETPGGWAANC